MTGIILLTVAGVDTGPFNLYSDVTGYSVPFATNISKLILTTGYPTDQIPNGTTIVRIQSVNEICSNYTDIYLALCELDGNAYEVTTTTTTTVALDCTIEGIADEITTTTTTTVIPTTTTTTTVIVLDCAIQGSAEEITTTTTTTSTPTTTTTITTVTPTTTTTRTTPAPITYYTFNLTAGTVGCNGAITWTPSGVITAYSNSPTLGLGVTLYTTPALITPISYDAVRSGIQIYELTDGVIANIVTVGSGC